MELRGLIGSFYRLCEWIMRISITNILWMICSSPFFFFVFAYLFSPPESPITIRGTFFWMAVTAPFTLFPATAALFTTTRKWVMGDVDVPLFRTFMRGLRDNFVQALIGGLVYVVFALILYFNYQFYADKKGLMGVIAILFLVFSVFLFASIFHFFSVMTHFHMKITQVIKNAIVLTFGNPLSSIFLIVANVAIIFICLWNISFLLPVLIMGVAVGYVSFWQFYRTFLKIQTLREKEEAEALQEDGEPTEPDEQVTKR